MIYPQPTRSDRHVLPQSARQLFWLLCVTLLLGVYCCPLSAQATDEAASATPAPAAEPDAPKPVDASAPTPPTGPAAVTAPTATPAEAATAGDAPPRRRWQPAGASAGERHGLPSLEVVAAKIAAIEADQTIDEAVRESLLAQWAAAQQAIEAAATSRELEKTFADRIERTPADLAKLTEALAEPMPDVALDVGPDATTDQLQPKLLEVEADLARARERLAGTEQEGRDRIRLRGEFPVKIAELRKRMQELTDQIERPAPPNEPAAVSEARLVRLRAERAAAEASIEAMQAELASYDVRGEILVKRLDQAKRNVLINERLAGAWQKAVTQARAKELQAQRLLAEELTREAAELHPAVGELAVRNATLVDQRTEVDLAMRQTHAQQAQVRAQLDEISRQYEGITEKVDAAGLTDAIGLLLRKYKEALPDQRKLRQASSTRGELMGQVQLQLIELDDRRAELIDIDKAVSAFMDQLDPPVDDAARLEHITTAAREQLTKEREFINDLRRDLDNYFFELGDLDTTSQSLLAQSLTFENYIDENVLWIPSGQTLGPAHIKPTISAATWLVSPTNWQAVGEAIWVDVRRNVVIAGLLVVVIILMLFMRMQLLTQLHLLAGLTKQTYTDSLMHSFKALAITFALAAGVPVAVYFVGYRLLVSPADDTFVKALGEGLQLAALVGLSLSIMRGLCRESGMGDAHFRWSESAIRQVRVWCGRLLYVLVPIVLVAAMFEAQPEEAWKESLGRLLFILMMLVIASAGFTLMRSDGGVLRTIARRDTGGWIARSRWLWYAAAVGGPIVLAGVAVVGYYYTAWQLSMRFFWTTWLLLLLVVVTAFAKRALTLSARQMALVQVRKRREAELAAREKVDAGNAPTPEVEFVNTPEPDVVDVSAQARQVIHTCIGFVLLMGVWFIWSPVLPALGILRNITLWGDITNPESNPVTLANVVLALILVGITVVATKNLPGLLEIAFLQRLPIGAGSRYAIVSVARYAIVIFGITIAFNTVGVGWGKLQWLIAAMSLGLGFGLQEIFANFVSGLIILAEQPIRVGDTVTVGGVTGRVTQIRMRATTVIDFDRKELIVPNKEFVTGQLINWSLSDPTLRIVVPVGVAYGSNNELVVKTLFKATSTLANVLEDPAPQVWFIGFGASSLDYECRVFIPSIDHLVRVRHELCLTIDALFREQKIEIAFPQRDLHIRSIQAVLPFAKVDKVEVDGQTIETISDKDEPPKDGKNGVQMPRPT